uniref:Venom peptide Pp16a n=1 Tax=Pristhesancus plagipennis TaxID=1955184 RepID=A0A2K8JLK7_PRIPG|nr:venom peptide Pp16a [Pristhesancus plagipennis]
MQFKFLVILAVVVFSALLCQVESTEVEAVKEVEAEHLHEEGGAREARKSIKGMLKKNVPDCYFKKIVIT